MRVAASAQTQRGESKVAGTGIAAQTRDCALDVGTAFTPDLHLIYRHRRCPQEVRADATMHLIYTRLGVSRDCGEGGGPGRLRRRCPHCTQSREVED
jgi:hypothetical protein